MSVVEGALHHGYLVVVALGLVMASVGLARRRALALGRLGAVLRWQARLLDESHDAAFIWRIGGGLLYWNKSARDLYGWTSDEALGRSPHELLRTECDGGMDALDRALARDGRWEGELVQTSRGGARVTVECRMVVVHRGAGLVYVLETNRDVTERLRGERERDALLEGERAARREAERAAHVKDEFVALVSHELRTPLNAILGWSAMLKKGHLDAPATSRAIEVIERNARAQAQLVEDLLDVSRIVSGKLRLDAGQVDLALLIEHAVSTHAPAAQAKGVRLERTIDPRAGVVEGDPARLAQVVSNLLTNAIKFTPKGGRVHLGVRRVGSRAEIVVRDTGNGIAPDFLPFLFDRFRQAESSTTRQHRGLGLGLALVKHLVELHGGEVSAESEGEGRGATFTVSLPIAAARREEGEGPTPIEACASLAGLKVLVVDDEEDARDLVRRILEECDAEVATAGSAREALDALQRSPPNVVVSDIGMPEVDGYELVRAIRKLDAERGMRTPAVALTAFSRSEDRKRALKSGYQAYACKPVDQAELILLIASVAGRLAPHAA